MFDRVVTKKRIFMGSGLVLVGALLWGLMFERVVRISSICRGSGLCADLLWDPVMIFAYIAVPVFLLSAITYRMKDKVFATWARFAASWLLPYVLIVSLIPHRVSGGLITIDSKPFMALLLALLFFVISLLIILVQSIRVYWLKK